MPQRAGDTIKTRVCCISSARRSCRLYDGKKHLLEAACGDTGLFPQLFEGTDV